MDILNFAFTVTHLNKAQSYGTEMHDFECWSCRNRTYLLRLIAIVKSTTVRKRLLNLQDYIYRQAVNMSQIARLVGADRQTVKKVLQFTFNQVFLPWSIPFQGQAQGQAAGRLSRFHQNP